MDEDDDTFEPLPATPMQGIDAVVLVLDLITNLHRTFGRFWMDTTELVCRHANYRVQNREFERTAGIEIERLVSGE